MCSNWNFQKQMHISVLLFVQMPLIANIVPTSALLLLFASGYLLFGLFDSVPCCRKTIASFTGRSSAVFHTYINKGA